MEIELIFFIYMKIEKCFLKTEVDAILNEKQLLKAYISTWFQTSYYHF